MGRPMSSTPGQRGPGPGPNSARGTRPRGPPPTSPYGMMNTPPSIRSGPGSGPVMNNPNLQRGPPNVGNMRTNINSNNNNNNNYVGRRGSIARGPPPRGPPPSGPPPTRKFPQGGSTPNGARMGPGRSPHLQGKNGFYSCNIHIHLQSLQIKDSSL